MHLHPSNTMYRKAAKDFPSMYRVCGVDIDLAKRFEEASIAYGRVGKELETVFDANDPSVMTLV